MSQLEIERLDFAERWPSIPFMLTVFCGLPGTGKTTLARAFAKERRAVYLRIDDIEDVLDARLIGPEGYLVAYAIADANLSIGNPVVADCVNPIQDTRNSWRRVAASHSTAIQEIEVVCSDIHEHRRRITSRGSPSWDDVLAREYSVWDKQPLVIDTAHRSVADCLEMIHLAAEARESGV